jgi:hypothetical protein
VPIIVHDEVTPSKYELPTKHGCVISETAMAVTARSDGAEDKEITEFKGRLLSLLLTELFIQKHSVKRL